MMSHPLVGRRASPELHAMSFNLRRPMDGILQSRRDRWSVRAPAVAALLRSERPTILGLQEMLPHALETVREALGPTHRFVGRGRGRGGTGEGVPLAYDAERLHLHGWEQRALSDSPNRPASRSWGNVIPRVLVRAEFSDRSTGTDLVVVNTHFDHLSPHSRRRSAEAVAALVKNTKTPSLVMGDLNAVARSRALRILLAQGDLVDCWNVAAQRLTPRWGTLSGYRRPRTTARSVDWMLVTAGMQVSAVGVNAGVFGGIRPSDHLAVQTVLRLDGATT